MVSFSGFELTKQLRRMRTIARIMVLIVCGLLIIGVGLVLWGARAQIHPQQPTIESISPLVVSAGFVIFFGMILGRSMRRARAFLKRIIGIYDQALTVCMEKTINLFQKTP